MNDEEFEDRLRSLKVAEPSAALDRRIAKTVRAHCPSTSQWQAWRLAAALLAGTIAGYGIARFEAARGASSAGRPSPAVQVIILREGQEARGLMDFSPAGRVLPSGTPTIEASTRKPSNI